MVGGKAENRKEEKMRLIDAWNMMHLYIAVLMWMCDVCDEE
tara:strand:- start:279 stop:401 length:123 start_codon:yes stop_codon:yes gene_type:complete